MKYIVLILIVLLVGCAGEKVVSDDIVASSTDFCGSSTENACSSDSDCKSGGCSNQVCQGVKEEVMTICDYKECYKASDYGLDCGCVKGQCAWN